MHLRISSYFDTPKFHDAEIIETMRVISEHSYFISVLLEVIKTLRVF